MEMVRFVRLENRFYKQLFFKLLGLCAILQPPSNGNVNMNGNVVGSTASYSCVTNYELVGAAIRNCTANSGWSSQDPLCCKGFSTCVLDINTKSRIKH